MLLSEVVIGVTTRDIGGLYTATEKTSHISPASSEFFIQPQ